MSLGLYGLTRRQSISLFGTYIIKMIARYGMPEIIVSAGYSSGVDIWSRKWASEHDVPFRALDVEPNRSVKSLAFRCTHILAFTNQNKSLRSELEERCKCFDVTLMIVATKY